MKCDCCYETDIYFDTYGECEDFGAQFISISIQTSCKISTCNDGLSHHGNYCGRGRCNIFGCNCDGGCRGGSDTDAVESFKNKFGLRVFNVHSNL